MSDPAWEEVPLIINEKLAFSEIGAEQLEGFSRPFWFKSGPTLECINYFEDLISDTKYKGNNYGELKKQKNIDQIVAQKTINKLDPKHRFELFEIGVQTIFKAIHFAIKFCRLKMFAGWMYGILQSIVYEAYIFGLSVTPKEQQRSPLYLDPLGFPIFKLWQEKYRELFPDRKDKLRYSDIFIWSNTLIKWKHLVNRFDVVIATATYGSIPLLVGRKDYACYEHGTLREIPFESDGQGRLCALTYRLARTVFVTNSDVMPMGEELGISRNALVPIPHGIENPFSAEKCGSNYPPFDGLRCSAAKSKVFLCPARHDWQNPNNQKSNNEIILAAKNLDSSDFDFRLIFVEWGQDVADSKSLVEALGLQHRVKWIEMHSKPLLRQLMADCDAIVDQFTYPAIGAASLEGLKSGKPVVTKINEETLKEFFGAAPPVYNAWDACSIAEAMTDILLTPQKAIKRGYEGPKWILNYHSEAVIFGILESELEKLTRTGKR